MGIYTWQVHACYKDAYSDDSRCHEIQVRRFLASSLSGSVVWTGTLVPLGYFIGKRYTDIMKYSEVILLLFIAIAHFR
jgi:membrane protein DedA with SNARE-associated domain